MIGRYVVVKVREDTGSRFFAFPTNKIKELLSTPVTDRAGFFFQCAKKTDEMNSEDVDLWYDITSGQDQDDFWADEAEAWEIHAS